MAFLTLKVAIFMKEIFACSVQTENVWAELNHLLAAQNAIGRLNCRDINAWVFFYAALARL